MWSIRVPSRTLSLLRAVRGSVALRRGCDGSSWRSSTRCFLGRFLRRLGLSVALPSYSLFIPQYTVTKVHSFMRLGGVPQPAFFDTIPEGLQVEKQAQAMPSVARRTPIIEPAQAAKSATSTTTAPEPATTSATDAKTGAAGAEAEGQAAGEEAGEEGGALARGASVSPSKRRKSPTKRAPREAELTQHEKCVPAGH